VFFFAYIDFVVFAVLCRWVGEQMKMVMKSRHPGPTMFYIFSHSSGNLSEHVFLQREYLS